MLEPLAAASLVQLFFVATVAGAKGDRVPPLMLVPMLVTVSVVMIMVVMVVIMIMMMLMIMSGLVLASSDTFDMMMMALLR